MGRLVGTVHITTEHEHLLFQQIPVEYHLPWRMRCTRAPLQERDTAWHGVLRRGCKLPLGLCWLWSYHGRIRLHRTIASDSSKSPIAFVESIGAFAHPELHTVESSTSFLKQTLTQIRLPRSVVFTSAIVTNVPATWLNHRITLHPAWTCKRAKSHSHDRNAAKQNHSEPVK